MPSSIVYTVKGGDAVVFPKSSIKHSRQDEYIGMATIRQCTDVFFLVAIVAMWSAMSIVGALAIRTGNPFRLVAPMNDQGQLCGPYASSGSLAESPVWYQVSTWGQGVCLPNCPVAKTPLPVTSLAHTDYVCLAWVQNLYGFTNTDANAAVNPGFQTYLQTACMSNGVFSPRGRYNPDLGACGCNLIYPTTLMFSRCVYSNSTVRAQFNQGYPDYFNAFMSDIITARFVIFAFGFLLAIFLSFVYSHVLRFERLSLVLVWGSIALSFSIMGALVGVCWWRALQWKNENPQIHSTTAVLALQVFSLLMMAFLLLFLCACIFLRRSINLAIKVVALAATALESMILLIFTPFLHVMGMAAFLVPCLLYGFYIASSGSITPLTTICYPGVNPLTGAVVVTTPPTCLPNSNGLTVAQRNAGVTVTTGYTYQLRDPDAAGEQLWFLFFCYLWTQGFIAGIGSLVVALSISAWYFTSFDERPSITSRTVLWSYNIVFKYHLGTAACGGLIIAMVQWARWMALYIEKHCKGIQSNCVARVTAIHGTNFCTGAKDAFFTIARNIFSVGAVSVVSGMALTIGKVAVVSVAGVSSYFFFQGFYPSQMYDTIACTVLVMIMAWISASYFAEVFHMAIDTVLMCYITDSEQNFGVPQHADPEMAEFLAQHGALTTDHKRVAECGINQTADGRESVL